MLHLLLVAAAQVCYLAPQEHVLAEQLSVLLSIYGDIVLVLPIVVVMSAICVYGVLLNSRLSSFELCSLRLAIPDSLSSSAFSRWFSV